MRRLFITLLLGCSVAAQAQTNDWMKAAKGALKSDTNETTVNEAPASLDFSQGLGSAISQGLGVTQAQADGGLGSLFGLAQSTLGSEDFATLASAVPGMDSLLNAAPALESAGGLGGLGGYAEALQGASGVVSQFQSLGLSASAIPQYVDITNRYLQSSGGQQAAQLFSKGVASLL